MVSPVSSLGLLVPPAAVAQTLCFLQYLAQMYGCSNIWLPNVLSYSPAMWYLSATTHQSLHPCNVHAPQSYGVLHPGCWRPCDLSPASTHRSLWPDPTPVAVLRAPYTHTHMHTHTHRVSLIQANREKWSLMGSQDQLQATGAGHSQTNILICRLFAPNKPLLCPVPSIFPHLLLLSQPWSLSFLAFGCCLNIP